MAFVVAVTNLRAWCYAIPQKSYFACKSIAGRIIPAIATTNAIIAGMIVLQAYKVLAGKVEECRHGYLSQNAMSGGWSTH
jgi:ubiquitin-like 1-activating enzyme E1 B